MFIWLKWAIIYFLNVKLKVLTENSLKKAFLTWMRKEASSPGRSVPLTHNIIIPLKVENKSML